MIRQIELTVTPQTTANNPQQVEIKLGKGVLSEVRIQPASGPNWEVYTRVLHLENSIIPDIEGQWIPLESELLTFKPEFNDWLGVYAVKIEICSPEARFSHTVQYALTLDEKPSMADIFSAFIKMGQ